MSLPFHRVARGLCLCVVVIVLFGCAADLYRVPTSFTPAGDTRSAPLLITATIEVKPSTGYTRILKAGSIWTLVGTIPQGAVYKIKDDVFMVEGAHLHEAYCVVSEGRLVGFYLPVEGAFAPLPEPIALK
jgi:hypothetical protein